MYDAETGLHYNYHRHYDPKTGRYTQSDPIGLQGGINTYGYVGGNPVGLSDPSGLVSLAPGSEFEGRLGGGGGLGGGAVIGGAIVGNIITDAIKDSESATQKGEACPPKPGNQDPCKGFREQLKEHKGKLAQYLNDPISMDNKDHLGNAIGKGNMDLFWKIRANRIKELMWQIENFRKQLEECEKRYG